MEERSTQIKKVVYKKKRVKKLKGHYSVWVGFNENVYKLVASKFQPICLGPAVRFHHGFDLFKRVSESG